MSDLLAALTNQLSSAGRSGVSVKCVRVSPFVPEDQIFLLPDSETVVVHPGVWSTIKRECRAPDVGIGLHAGGGHYSLYGIPVIVDAALPPPDKTPAERARTDMRRQLLALLGRRG